jgi:hypothetical protein
MTYVGALLHESDTSNYTRWAATSTRTTFLLMAVMFATSADLAFAQGKKGAGAATASAAAQPAPPASSSAAIESQMLAYGGLDHIAAAVAATVCATIPKPAPAVKDRAGHIVTPEVPTSTVVIYDQASFASLQSYQAFIANADALVSLYETLLDAEQKKKLEKQIADAASKRHPQWEMPRALGLSSTIDPFSDATALLSAIAVSSNSETPNAIVIPDSAMAVALTRELMLNAACATKTPSVVYPPFFGHSSATDFASADIQTDLQTLDDVRAAAVQAVDTANTKWMIDNQTKPGGNPVLAAALTDVDGLYDSFMNSLLQVNSASGVVGSASVIQGYQLANVLAGQAEPNGSFQHPAFILLASILSAGGTELDHKTFWTALGSGDKITYSGGVIVNVSLWHADDLRPLYSNVLRYRVPFSDVQKPADLAG